MSMAKKMISRLSVLAVLIVFLAACSKQTEYTNVIPADATAVASIDLKSLANKAGMNDKENEAAKQKLLEAMKSCQPGSEADGYSFTTLNGNLLAFNETTAIIISASRTSQTEAAKEAITKLMKQTADNSIAKSGAFQKLAKQKSDINFFASMSAIPSTYRSQISMGLPSEIKPEDITILGGLNFENGKIALKTENYTEHDAVKALLKNSAALCLSPKRMK